MTIKGKKAIYVVTLQCIQSKDLRGKLKTSSFPPNIFGLGRGILFRVSLGCGYFLPGYGTFFPGISGINLNLN